MFAPPPPAKKNWAIDVLTTDYRVSGIIDGDRNALAFQLSGEFPSLILTSARIQATGNFGVPESFSAPWAVAYGDTLVAVIPRDAASREYAMRRNSDWKHPQAAKFSTGFIVQQASISSLLPGARLSGLSAPYAMFVGRHKHLVRLAA